MDNADYPGLKRWITCAIDISQQQTGGRTAPKGSSELQIDHLQPKLLQGPRPRQNRKPDTSQPYRADRPGNGPGCKSQPDAAWEYLPRPAHALTLPSVAPHAHASSTSCPRQAHTMPTPGAQHAHARRTARTPQAHASSSTRTRAQHPTTTSTQAHNQRQACRRPRARKRTYTRTTRDKHALPGPRPPIARTSCTTRKADHARPPQNRRRLGTTWRRRRDHGPGHNIPQNHRPRPRPRTRTTPVAAHGRPRTRTPTHTDAFPRLCRGTANYSRPPSPARLLRSGCGRRSPARPCRASFHHSPSARALRAARTHAEPRRSITTIAQSPPVARLSLRPQQRRRTHVSACLPPGAGPQSPANERPASAPPVFGGRGGRPRPAPLTIGPRSPATPHGAPCTHPPVPTPCTHTAPTCHTP